MESSNENSSSTKDIVQVSTKKESKSNKEKIKEKIKMN